MRNNAAALHLKAMRRDDEVLLYHSNVGMAVVGIAKVAREAFPDPSDPANRFVAVELSPVRALTSPVTLAEMKATLALAEMAMLRQGRLSVSPVSAAEWETILRLAGG